MRWYAAVFLVLVTTILIDSVRVWSGILLGTRMAGSPNRRSCFHSSARRRL